ncbi:phage integrase N-terminal SAM-like domain-containing protein [Catenovulum sp. 2E275]|uniref:phage integrase N-terminal SAM-like domain-containing protein n=1 Tax=Catenovulum sp. 2E275 TaxID=2980497 RepID=UPI0021CFDEC1|nr:phage integrase N-terminal SAM-like domain-containing protein [Catenovulum sp. 2E275]MCU4676769.1 phage integrase N-terminal SAM-like domain-containing protein [Catenovulum sp. 2E275]
MSKSPFLESIRAELRIRHYSYQTEKAYLHWIKCFIRFNDYKHPENMGNFEIERFLTHLAVNKQVNAATQNQALCAIIFVYKNILNKETDNLNFRFTKKQVSMPVVISHDEAVHIINLLPIQYKLIASLLFGAGLRINEALRLRIKDIDFNNQLKSKPIHQNCKIRYKLLHFKR